MPGEKWAFLFFILNRLTVYYSCRYTLQLTSSTLEHVFTTYNYIHLAHFPLICILGCIHMVHIVHFPFHLYVVTVLVFYSVAPIISVYSMWAFYALLLWHANLPRGSIHTPKASVHCVGEVFVCTPSQSMSPLPAHSIIPWLRIQQLLFYPSTLLLLWPPYCLWNLAAYLVVYARVEFFTLSYQRNLTDNGTRDRRSRTRKFLLEK